MSRGGSAWSEADVVPNNLARVKVTERFTHTFYTGRQRKPLTICNGWTQ